MSEQNGSVGIAVWAGLIGGALAVVSCRPRTRVENLLIGGLFTGFAAYRDPRASAAGTLLVAAAEGAIWGLGDRVAPWVKDALVPVQEQAQEPLPVVV